MGAIVNLEGERFGRLLVIKKTKKRDKSGGIYWECKCDCGNLVDVVSRSLRFGNTKSCGCWRTESRYLNTKDMIGKKFGRFEVVSKVEKQDRYRNNFYMCKCECGKIKKVRGYALRNGSIRSCGCLAIEFSKSREIDLTGVKSGRLTVIEKSNKESKRGYYWLCKCECGKTKDVLGENIREKKTLSCGCLRIEAMHKMRGENSPHYKKELTDEHRILGRYILGKSNILNWRISVYERDNYTCAICKTKGIVLNAHHLNGWHWCEEGRFDIDNGITLCKNCHESFHKTFGYGDNTKEQFEEFSINCFFKNQV